MSGRRVELAPVPPARRGKRSKRKLGRGWIAVNISNFYVAEMRLLARAAGFNFRTFCCLALLHYNAELESMLGVNGWSLTPESAERLRARSEALFEAKRAGKCVTADEALRRN